MIKLAIELAVVYWFVIALAPLAVLAVVCVLLYGIGRIRHLIGRILR